MTESIQGDTDTLELTPLEAGTLRAWRFLRYTETDIPPILEHKVQLIFKAHPEEKNRAAIAGFG